MSKTFKIVIVALLFFIGCKEVIEPVSEIPSWLSEKIQVYEKSCVYYGSKVTRYNWNTSKIYEFNIPIFSCAYCYVYYENGDTVVWNDSTIKIKDYVKYRTNKKVLWQHNDDSCIEP